MIVVQECHPALDRINSEHQHFRLKIGDLLGRQIGDRPLSGPPALSADTVLSLGHCFFHSQLFAKIDPQLVGGFLALGKGATLTICPILSSTF